MILRRAIRRAFSLPPVPELLVRCRTRKHVAVLGYHRILPPPDRDYPFHEGVVSATPEEFAKELRFLRANMDVISMPELVTGLRDPRQLPPRPAVITFDDGYRDNFTYAFPLLREAGLPACFFVCTGLVGTRKIPWYEAWVCCLKCSRVPRIPSPFGRDDPPYELGESQRPQSIVRFRRHMRNVPWSQIPSCLERIREMTRIDPNEFLQESLFMSVEDIRRLADGGMDIGGHTRTHPILSRIEDVSTLRDEIVGCYRDIADALGRDPIAFAYPWGDVAAMSDEADTAIRDAGFQVSFSFRNSLIRPQAGKTWRLPRVHASYGDDYAAFRRGMATATRP